MEDNQNSVINKSIELWMKFAYQPLSIFWEIYVCYLSSCRPQNTEDQIIEKIKKLVLYIE